MARTSKIKQSGAVSLFVVVFSTLLVTVVTVGFIGLMVRNQKQASDSDLSQSAYDSAMAGVEDGKRAILRYLNCEEDSSPTGCEDIISKMGDQDCLNIVGALEGVDISNNEVAIKSEDNADLDQAYTCLKITMDTPDFLGVIEKDGSKLIPLKADGDYNQVKIDWFTVDDLISGDQANIPSISASKERLMIGQNDWSNRPAIMRAQLVQYSSTGFKLDYFDNNSSDNSNTNTLFLYPSNLSSPVDLDFITDSRRSPMDYGNALQTNIHCKSDFNAAPGYACTATIKIPDPIGGSASNRVAYLNLTALYNKANFRVSLLDNGSVVNFMSVQPEIDSNGRASDLFRRVKARIEISNLTSLVPGAAVEVIGDGTGEGSFCKNYTFYSDSQPSGSCD